MSDFTYLRTAPLATTVDRYLLELQIANYSPRTVEVNAYKLKRLAQWCDERGVGRVDELSAEVVQGYLRSLQTYLGHERLDTTQIYTHMTLGRLREVHDQTHPTGDGRMRPTVAGPEDDPRQGDPHS